MCVHWRMRQVKCCLPSHQRHCKNLVDIINFMQRALYRGLFLWLISFCKPAAIFKKNKMRLSFSIFSALLPFENVKISLSPRWTLEQQQHSLWKQSLCFVNKEKKREKNSIETLSDGIFFCASSDSSPSVIEVVNIYVNACIITKTHMRWNTK